MGLAERERRHDHQRMQLELVTQLPFGDKDGVQEFLDLGVASLGIRQDLANEVHRTQHIEGVSLFFSLYHQGSADHLRGGRNVEQNEFSIGRRNQDRSLRQELLDRVKCQLSLGCPFEVVDLLQESIKGETSFVEA